MDGVELMNSRAEICGGCARGVDPGTQRLKSSLPTEATQPMLNQQRDNYFAYLSL